MSVSVFILLNLKVNLIKAAQTLAEETFHQMCLCAGHQLYQLQIKVANDHPLLLGSQFKKKTCLKSLN